MLNFDPKFTLCTLITLLPCFRRVHLPKRKVVKFKPKYAVSEFIFENSTFPAAYNFSKYSKCLRLDDWHLSENAISILLFSSGIKALWTENVHHLRRHLTLISCAYSHFASHKHAVTIIANSSWVYTLCNVHGFQWHHPFFKGCRYTLLVLVEHESWSVDVQKREKKNRQFI